MPSKIKCTPSGPPYEKPWCLFSHQEGTFEIKSRLIAPRKFDGCLVTSDSDFTGLATRIREEGLTVLGFGEQKTPDAFRNACHKFILTEVLRPSATESEKVVASSKIEPDTAQSKPSNQHQLQPAVPRKFLLDALEQSSDENGWAHLGTFGSYLTKLQPDFDSRIHGYKKLSDLVKAKTDLFVTEERMPHNQSQKNLYLRAK